MGALSFALCILIDQSATRESQDPSVIPQTSDDRQDFDKKKKRRKKTKNFALRLKLNVHVIINIRMWVIYESVLYALSSWEGVDVHDEDNAFVSVPKMELFFPLTPPESSVS